MLSIVKYCHLVTIFYKDDDLSNIIDINEKRILKIILIIHLLINQTLTWSVSDLVTSFMRDSLDVTFFIYLHANTAQLRYCKKLNN